MTTPTPRQGASLKSLTDKLFLCIGIGMVAFFAFPFVATLFGGAYLFVLAFWAIVTNHLH